MYEGVPRATDDLKMLALDAKYVFIGRLWVWAPSIAGEHGVRHIVKSLLAGFDILLEVAVFQNIEQINRVAIDSLLSSYSLIVEHSQI